MSRVYNFSAGPAVLPEEVLKEVADEMMDYNGTGMSVMEMSHRSAAFQEIIDTAEKDLRELMNIPDNYKVLFLQGGASQQFAMIPMNLMKNKVADYIVTGQWAKKAYQEAQKYGKANKIAQQPLPQGHKKGAEHGACHGVQSKAASQHPPAQQQHGHVDHEQYCRHRQSGDLVESQCNTGGTAGDEAGGHQK